MLMTPVAKDSPLWAAWKAYQASEGYDNTKIHAINPEHTEGSLWAAFSAGWAAGLRELGGQKRGPVTVRGEVER